MERMLARLIIPDKGYYNILLIEKVEYKWFVEICGSGLELYVYVDEFIIDNKA